MEQSKKKNDRLPGVGVGSFDTGIRAEVIDAVNPGAFKSLYEEEYFGIRKFLTRKLGNDRDAEELTQDVFLNIWKAGNFNAIQNRRAFAYKVASNLAVDWIRRQKRKESWEKYLTHREADRVRGISNSVESAEQDLALTRRQRIDAIMAVIKKLPVKCQKAFILNKFKGLSYPEVAAELSVSKSMVEKYISRALAQLRASDLYEADPADADARNRRK